jgi:hypothetical protein
MGACSLHSRRTRLRRRSRQGGELVVNLREEGIPGNKRVPARLLRVFAFRDSAHADSGRNAVLDIAVDGGWKLHQSGKGDTENVYFGGKRLPTGPAMVEIRQYDEHGVDKVSIRLEHTEARGSCVATGRATVKGSRLRRGRSHARRRCESRRHAEAPE